eukprot:COSAG06_NODE_26525_length_613_cov_0.350195_1_plen_142_part_01
MSATPPRRVTIFAVANLAVAEDGTVGETSVLGRGRCAQAATAARSCRRALNRRRSAPLLVRSAPGAHACNGLIALRHELLSGELSVALDPSDLECATAAQQAPFRPSSAAAFPSPRSFPFLRARAFARCPPSPPPPPFPFPP